MILDVVKSGWENKLILRFVRVRLNRSVFDGGWMVWYFFNMSIINKFLINVVSDNVRFINVRVIMNGSGLFLVIKFLVSELYIFW